MWNFGHISSRSKVQMFVHCTRAIYGKNSRWQSLVLFNTNSAVGNLQLIVGKLPELMPPYFLAHDANAITHNYYNVISCLLSLSILCNIWVLLSANLLSFSLSEHLLGAARQRLDIQKRSNITIHIIHRKIVQSQQTGRWDFNHLASHLYDEVNVSLGGYFG